jgi:hypothetical protein
MSLLGEQYLSPFRCRSHHQLTPPLTTRLHYEWRPTPPALLRPGPPPEHPRTIHPCSSPSPPESPSHRSSLLYHRPPAASPRSHLLATVAAVAALFSVLYALGHTEHAHLTSASATTGTASAADEKDDPSQIDTIVLCDPADAPVPARPGGRSTKCGQSIAFCETFHLLLPVIARMAYQL